MMNILECHSHGDRRFSAFYACLADGRSIEEVYQAAKYDQEGQPFVKGKGHRPSYLRLNGKLVPCDQRFRQEFYLMLWYIYLRENPDLFVRALGYNAYRDQFAWKGVVIPAGSDYYYDDGRSCNQAAAICYLCRHEIRRDAPRLLLFSGEVLTAYEKYATIHHPQWLYGE